MLDSDPHLFEKSDSDWKKIISDPQHGFGFPYRTTHVPAYLFPQDGSKPGIVGYQPGPPPEGYIPSLPTLIPFPPPVISVPPPGYHPMGGGAQKRPYDGSGYEVPNKR